MRAERGGGGEHDGTSRCENGSVGRRSELFLREGRGGAAAVWRGERQRTKQSVPRWVRGVVQQGAGKGEEGGGGGRNG